MNGAPLRIENVVNNFWSALTVSLVIAALDYILFPGAPRVSAFLTFVWIVFVVFAFTRFKWRAFWFLLGTPLAGYWLLVLYLIASGCSQNLRNCP